ESQRVPRVGYLSPSSSDRMRPYEDAFRTGLNELGYVEGKNLHIEYRYSDDDDQLSKHATELAALNVDIIVTFSNGIYPAKRATTTIPIVMAVGDEVVIQLGMVESLAHPGGNITGSTFFYPELMAKRLELLKAIAPSATSVGVLVLRNNPAAVRV